MKELIVKLYNKFRNLILYGVIGSSSACLDFCIFTLLTSFTGIHYLVANCISVTCGLANSFILNRKYNFKVTDKTAKRAVMFYAVGFLGLAFSSGLLYLFCQVLGMPRSLSKLLAIILEVSIQFVVNSLVTFGKRIK